MTPLQKYPHITELFACTRKRLAFIFSFLINYFISSGTCSTPKLSKYTISLLLQNKAIQCVLTCAYLWRFITYVLSFRHIISWNNFIKSWFILTILLCFKVRFKGWGGIKNPILFHNQFLHFLFHLCFENQLLQFLSLIIISWETSS